MKIALLLLAAAILPAANTSVVFDPANPATGPYPSDALTVPDSAQKTGRRINLPTPDCAADRFTCIVLPSLNRLDGFNIQPRIRVRFSGPINPDTLRDGIFFVVLDNLTNEEFGLGKIGDVIPINEVVYDPATNSAFAKPDSFLDQHRRFALVVTNGVKDAAGDPVLTGQSCRAAAPGCPAPADAAILSSAGFSSSSIAAATTFTTASATAWLERARDNVDSTDPAFQPGTVVDLARYPSAIWHQQTGAATFNDTPLPFALLRGVSRVAFGTYTSPSYLNAGLTIAMPPTAAPLPPPARTEQIPFNVFLPASPKPAAGYPVAIFGHGFGSDRFVSPGAAASSFAAAGWAVIAINAVGHGLGPQSSITFSGPAGRIDIPAPGRGVSQSASGAIGNTDGCLILVPAPIGARDCGLQTVVDLLQLSRLLRSGLDLDGDGSVDLDPSRIAYAGHSYGAAYGTLFSAVDPSVPVSALVSGGGSTVSAFRLSPNFRPLLTQYFAAVIPSFLNAGASFDSNHPLRYEPVRVNTVKGAIELQDAFEKVEWLNVPGEALNFAPHLVSSTLPGLPIKRIFFQYAIGDQTLVNPAGTALVLAANLRESTRIYRADLARAANPLIPLNPHAFQLDIVNTANLPVAIAAQTQFVGFLASGGTRIPDVNPSLRDLFGGNDLFETPAFLPETLGFLK